MALVNIREYYEKDGEMQPGKKVNSHQVSFLIIFTYHLQGISLPLDQYFNLISILPDIEKLLIKKGEQVPRPKYDRGNKLGDKKKDTDSEESDEEESEEREADSASDEEETKIN
jgi:Transcriptional Coactivator p15 (PC4)